MRYLSLGRRVTGRRRPWWGWWSTSGRSARHAHRGGGRTGTCPIGYTHTHHTHSHTLAHQGDERTGTCPIGYTHTHDTLTHTHSHTLTHTRPPGWWENRYMSYGVHSHSSHTHTHIHHTFITHTRPPGWWENRYTNTLYTHSHTHHTLVKHSSHSSHIHQTLITYSLHTFITHSHTYRYKSCGTLTLITYPHYQVQWYSSITLTHPNSLFITRNSHTLLQSYTQ